jgi:hypothetical protein
MFLVLLMGYTTKKSLMFRVAGRKIEGGSGTADDCKKGIPALLVKTIKRTE